MTEREPRGVGRRAFGRMAGAGRRKIFNVHFRNIQGRFLDFRETFAYTFGYIKALLRVLEASA